MNHMLRFAGVILVTALLSACNAQAGGARAAPAGFLLTDEDRVVFFGDRLCQPPTFGSPVETFIRVRYPDLKARIWHYGQRNSTAADGNARFDEQVARWKPTVIVLCFGLEDPGMKPFEQSKLDAFEAEYRKLLERSQATGAKVWVLTPPCPDVTKRRELKKIEYDKLIGKYAAVIRKVAADRGISVLDWYQATVDYRARHGDNPKLALTRPSGLDPTPLGAALATDLILTAWQATPLTVTIETDWTLSTPPAVSAGSIEVTKPNDDVMRISLKGIPLPWYVPRRGAVLADDWPPARFCNYTLKINHVPDAGFIIAEAGQPRGRGAKPFLGRMLLKGTDVGHIGPLATAKPVNELASAINMKNRSYLQLEAFKKTKPPEPEFAEAYKTYALFVAQHADAAARVALRKPKTMDIDLEVKTAKAAAAQARKKTERPQPPATQPAATRPATRPAATQPAPAGPKE